MFFYCLKTFKMNLKKLKNFKKINKNLLNFNVQCGLDPITIIYIRKLWLRINLNLKNFFFYY